MPAWLARAAQGGPRRLRVWSAGCSSGEEAYSIAITILEALGTPLRWDLRLLATDLDTSVLTTACRGAYPAARLGALPHPQLARYFLRGRGAWREWVRVRPELQALIAFRFLNLNAPSWPLRQPFDAIFCRNVLIYFDPATQHRVCERLLQQLAPGGHLLLGASESLPGCSHLATPLGPTIYQRLAPAPGGGPA